MSSAVSAKRVKVGGSGWQVCTRWALALRTTCTTTCVGMLLLSLATSGCGAVASESSRDAGAQDHRPTPDAHGGSHPASGDGRTREDASERDAVNLRPPDASLLANDASLDGESTDADRCQATLPGPGAACDRIGTACAFDAIQCDCIFTFSGPKWNCFGCPSQQPPDGTSCTVPEAQLTGYVCAYGASNCGCSLGDGGTHVWSCEPCPRMPPTNGTPCRANGACLYGGTFGPACTCSSLEWSCVLPCPAVAPVPGDPCAFREGMACDYGTKTCSCQQDVAFCS